MATITVDAPSQPTGVLNKLDAINQTIAVPIELASHLWNVSSILDAKPDLVIESAHNKWDNLTGWVSKASGYASSALDTYAPKNMVSTMRSVGSAFSDYWGEISENPSKAVVPAAVAGALASTALWWYNRKPKVTTEVTQTHTETKTDGTGSDGVTSKPSDTNATTGAA